MSEPKSSNHVTKFDAKGGELFHENIHVIGKSADPVDNGGVKVRGCQEATRTNAKQPPHTASPTDAIQKSPLRSSPFKRLKPHEQRQPETFVNNYMEPAPETHRIRNYQIKSVKRGVPVISPMDSTVQRIIVEKKDLRITPYWICQKRKENTKRTATAWIFSGFVTFVSVVCPLTSFASDVAFYVTCSDHYNHTAELLTKVREGAITKSDLTNDPLTLNNGDEGDRAISPRPPEYAQGVKDGANKPYDNVQPAPLLSRNRRGIQKASLGYIEQSLPLDVSFGSDNHGIDVGTFKSNAYIPRSHKSTNQVETDDRMKRKNHFVTLLSHEKRRGINLRAKGRMRPKRAEIQRLVRVVPEDSRQTNFEVTVLHANDSACDSPDVVLAYMLTDKAATELEAHRHVTIDIFEPVFILGSFPSLILCILTRLVVLITAHKNFLSAYVTNMACMPLQLVTGALSVHSATYHLGKKGFECWHCAFEGDCSDMDPLWWLEDGVTKSLIVSIATKVLDGVAGGLVLFIVIIRLLWSQGGHATFWWNLLRWLVIVAAFIFCVTVSPILVITPALGVMRLEFMELATPFPGLDRLSFALMALMGYGLATWCLSFAVLLVYLCYSMYMYCRERTIDR